VTGFEVAWRSGIGVARDIRFLPLAVRTNGHLEEGMVQGIKVFVGDILGLCRNSTRLWSLKCTGGGSSNGSRSSCISNLSLRCLLFLLLAQ
jgi:hypothetical protein